MPYYAHECVLVVDRAELGSFDNANEDEPMKWSEEMQNKLDSLHETHTFELWKLRKANEL